VCDVITTVLGGTLGLIITAPNRWCSLLSVSLCRSSFPRSSSVKMKIMFKPLNPLLHSELRLAVMSVLIDVDKADFTFLKEQTGATSDNLSVQIDKLSAAGYVAADKTFKGKRPCTLCTITDE
jgi:DNA-binding transcriptional ArsR family regulator